MDKSAEETEMKPTIPRVDKGTESISVAVSPLERTRSLTSERLGIRGTNVKKKFERIGCVGDMRTDACMKYGAVSEKRLVLYSDFPFPVSTWLCRTTSPLDDMSLFRE
jgi:hypothetical protein